MEYTEKQKREIYEAAAYLKNKGYREESDFSLYSTAALMVEYSQLKPVEIPEITDEEIENASTDEIDPGIAEDFQTGRSMTAIRRRIWSYGAKWYRSELKKRITK